MKYTNVQVGFREIPDKMTLLINLSGCQIHCPGCHSKYLWEDIGDELTDERLLRLITYNHGVNTICFMGGNDIKELNRLAKFIEIDVNKDYKIGWYTGLSEIPEELDLDLFDYIKVGPYIEEKGPLDKETTNQKLFEVVRYNEDGTRIFNPNEYILKDITYKFWDKKQLTKPIQ